MDGHLFYFHSNNDVNHAERYLGHLPLWSILPPEPAIHKLFRDYYTGSAVSRNPDDTVATAQLSRMVDQSLLIVCENRFQVQKHIRPPSKNQAGRLFRTTSKVTPFTLQPLCDTNWSTYQTRSPLESDETEG